MLIENKIKIYRLLGAEQFQKIVFKLEEWKYLIIDKFFPNINIWYENLCNKKYTKAIKKEKKEENVELLKYFQYQKMLFRKERVYKQNRNYHYDHNHPTKFIEYLNYNKKIHINGVIKNIITLIGIGGISLFIGSIPMIIGLIGVYELISLFINFECINLQNYNICRFENERTKILLEKTEQKQLTKNIKQYGECIKPVSKAVCNQIELPTVDEVVNQITTREQAVQLLNYAKQQLTYMEKNIPKQKRR